MLRIDKEIQYSFSFHVFFFSLFSLFCTISIEADRGATSREFRPVDGRAMMMMIFDIGGTQNVNMERYFFYVLCRWRGIGGGRR